MNRTWTTLIGAAELRALLADGATPVIVDCGFDLADPDAGERAWRESHLPGSHYLHLDRDLSGAKTGRNGRHPLPERSAFAATLGRLGVTPATQVIVLDRQGGPYAARLWWMLRWMGHEAVAVLDGGIDAWVAAGGALGDEAAAAAPQPPYPASAPAMPSVSAAELLASLGQRAVLDARAGERRLSDFLLFEGAYAELHFCDTLWPDFAHADLQAAVQDFGRRERRFGKTSEQIQREHGAVSDAA